MQRHLLALTTGLLLHQGLYYLYLLEAAGLFTWPGFPYRMFALKLFNEHSIYLRALLTITLWAIHYPAIAGSIHNSANRLLGYFLVSCLFLFFDRFLGLYSSLVLLPVMILLLLLPLRLQKAKDRFAIDNPKQHGESPHSIALPAEGGALPLNNPQRGIYVLGNQGSGKTRFVLEPIIYQMIQKGYAGVIYDYDFEGMPLAPEKSYCLSKFAYNCLLKHKPPGMDIAVINFTDLTRTRRINPFAPQYIEDRAYLEEYVSVLLANLAPDQKESFWISSTKVLLKSILVLLSTNYSQYCTLPHALALATCPIQEVLTAIKQDEEARAYASSVLDAFEGGDKAAAQLAGITASLKVSLQLLLNPRIFWVLSEEEVDLRINAPGRPTILCIGNHPPAKAAYSPVIALLLTICFKSMYGHNRVKSFVAIDELPTLYIPHLSELPATARKYGISTIACVQSNAQLEDTHGETGARKIQQTLVNKFIGNVEDNSAVYGSELLGKTDKPLSSSSRSSSSHEQGMSDTHSVSEQLQERPLLPPQAFMGFAPGEFAGKVAESDSPFFHKRLQPVVAKDKAFKNGALSELPQLRSVEDIDLEANYKRIWAEARSVLEGMNATQAAY